MKKQRLISIKEFRYTYFSDQSRPSQSSVLRWIVEGAIAGKIIVSSKRRAFYVDADAWELSSGFSDVDEFLKDVSNFV